MIKDTKLTCGNCQLICWGDTKETKENFNILINSGWLIQKENGEITVLPTDEAKKEFEKMSPKHQKLYFREFKR